jgi:ADP-heptose:LPS heptosyltransferase
MTKRAALFVSAGMGDALLLIPLVKRLKEEGYTVSGIFTSKVPNETIFQSSTIFDEVIVAKGKASLALLALKKYKLFQLSILNYFAANKTNLFVAQKIANMVHANRIPENAGKKMAGNLVYFKPQEHMHDAEQNMLLLGKGFTPLSETLMQIDPPAPSLDLPEHYVALQISAGNNMATYKNWSVKHWICFLKQCTLAFPKLRFVMIGDEGEKILADAILEAQTANVISLVGKTSLLQVVEVISRASCFLGLDGGPMHASVALGKPGMSLWGPSSPELYGYGKLNPDKFKVVSLSLSCSPCSAWIGANASRVNDAARCPDHKCMQELSPEQVFREFSNFVKLQALV